MDNRINGKDGLDMFITRRMAHLPNTHLKRCTNKLTSQWCTRGTRGEVPGYNNSCRRAHVVSWRARGGEVIGQNGIQLEL